MASADRTWRLSILIFLAALTAACAGDGEDSAATQSSGGGLPPPGNTAPAITGTPLPTVQAGSPYSFTPAASDANGDVLNFGINNRPAWASFSTTTGQLQGTPTAAGTFADITIGVSDGTAVASLPAFTITVTSAPSPPPPPPPNSPPTISGSPPLTVQAGSLYSFTPTASDANGDVLNFGINNRPAWASFSTTTGQLQGTPAAAGTFSNITIGVSDGTATVMLPAFAITVTSAPPPPPPPNSPPVISGSPPTSVLQNSQYSFTPTASDPNNNPLTFSITNRPTWATFSTSTGQLQGTPTAANVGTYTNIAISVSDGTATAALPAFTITVVAVGTGSATLTWTAPTQNEDGSPLTDLTSYRIYWGTASRNYTNNVTVTNPGLTTYVVGNLLSGTTYYFATAAGNSQGTYSAYSNEATKAIP